MIDPDTYTIEDYLNQDFLCSCEKTHSVSVKKIVIEENALSKLADIITSFGYKKAFFLYDQTTYPIAGQTIEQIMSKHKLFYSSYILPDKEPIADEKTLADVLIHFDNTCDFMIAVGSGTLNDTCRFISYQMNLDYSIIATAPSMDGFASNVAPLITNNMKVTYTAQVPVFILGDLNILKEAPLPMIAAGVGDILGKYTCLCDWQMAHIINDEYHCQTLVSIVSKSIRSIVENIDQIEKRNPNVIRHIMEGLILSGIAMSFAGNSRPASGSEHHISHYWEMMFLFENKKAILHGTKVGIGTVAVLKAYELLLNKTIDFNKAREAISSFSQTNWENNMKRCYGKAWQDVVLLEKETGKNQPASVIERLNKMEHSFDLIKTAANELPTADSIVSMLRKLHAPIKPSDVGIEDNVFLDSFNVAKELRNRYGLLQMLFDLGISEEIGIDVLDYFRRI